MALYSKQGILVTDIVTKKEAMAILADEPCRRMNFSSGAAASFWDSSDPLAARVMEDLADSRRARVFSVAPIV